MSYLELDIRGERFCAYPADGVPEVLWRNYPVRGGAKLRFLLRIASKFHLDNLFLRRVENPLAIYGCEADALQKALMKLFCGREIRIAFAWPAPSRSAGRIYAFAFAAGGAMLAYVKMANEAKDIAELGKEVKALNMLATKSSLPFSFPSILGEGMLGNNVRYAVFGLLPSDCDEVHWSGKSWDESLKALHDAFAAGSRRTLSKGDALATAWAESFRSRACSEDYELLVRSCMAGAKVSANHGDMALHNIRRKNGRWWLFDWETFADDAPMLVDELTVYVCTRYFIGKCGYTNLLEQLKKDYPRKDNSVAACIVQAAAFIYAYDLSFANEFLSIFREYGKAL